MNSCLKCYNRPICLKYNRINNSRELEELHDFLKYLTRNSDRILKEFIESIFTDLAKDCEHYQEELS